jgi:hypothetical protein
MKPTIKLAILGIVLLLIVIVIWRHMRSEHFESSGLLPEKQAFCEAIGGTVVKSPSSEYISHVACQLPNPIPDAMMLNFQLAGKVCDIDLLLEEKRCTVPGQTTVPYAYTAGNGNFGWYP